MTSVNTGCSFAKSKKFADQIVVWCASELLPAVQVLFEGKRAIGVEMVRRSRKRVISTKREVILSAGAIGSSKLLLLSGVGPKQHLNEMKVSRWYALKKKGGGVGVWG